MKIHFPKDLLITLQANDKLLVNSVPFKVTYIDRFENFIILEEIAE